MKILGISDSHDSGVVVWDDGEVVYAANEERFNRKKLYWGFPRMALENAFKTLSITPQEIAFVAMGPATRLSGEEDIDYKNKKNYGLLPGLYGKVAQTLPRLIRSEAVEDMVCRYGGFHRLMTKNSWKGYLGEFGLDRKKIAIYRHHLCHAASAYYSNPKEEAAVITLDCSGDGLSGSLYHCSGSRMNRLSAMSPLDSLGFFYNFITHLCGFKASHHGGKVTGLAAYGEGKELYGKFKKIFVFDQANLRIRNQTDSFLLSLLKVLEEAVAGHSREEIASAAQLLLEDLIQSMVSAAVQKTGCGDICAAGGIFANVRLNQKILDMEEVKSLYVFPHMGDGGLAFGAACLGARDEGVLKGPKELKSAYLGPPLEMNQVPPSVKRVEGDPEEIPRIMAKALEDKKVVGLVEGRMEFGPRALCHRSILAEPTDKTMKDWLNDRLNRTEFMPFAPVVTAERAREYFKVDERFDRLGRFMTSCAEVTDLAREKAPGIVHVDGTARPQIVNSQLNSTIHRTLQEYEKLTTLPLCVNTSFNRHEEPIVNRSEDAIAELERGTIDLLVLDKQVFTRN